MTLRPNSLFARLFLVMVVVLGLAQLAALAIHLDDRRQVMQSVLGQQSAQRIADLVTLLDQQAPAARRMVLRAYRNPGLRVALLGTVDVVPDGDDAPPARRLAGLLREALGQARQVRVRLLDAAEIPRPGYGPMGPPHRRHRADPSWNDAPPGVPPMHLGRWAPMAGAAALRVEVQLLDGSWARFDRLVPAELYGWPLRMLASVGLVLVATLVVVYFAARRLTRPLRELAGAADNLGRDLNAQPLDESGPAEIRRAASAFNRMQRRLRAHVDERTRMLTAISHDLKTPLTRMRLRLELLEDAAAGSKLAADLDEMEGMLKASLAFARGIRAEPVQTLDLAELVRRLVADYVEAGQAVALVSAPLELPVQARPQALRRCCANLIDNALRYAGSAELGLDGDAETVSLVCRDRGPGIPADLLEAVFEPFKRLEDSRNRETGGSGLGLAIALDIARAHGGGLSLRNRAGGGLEARLELPR